MSFLLNSKKDMSVSGLVDEVERLIFEQMEDGKFNNFQLLRALNKVRAEYYLTEWRVTMEKRKLSGTVSSTQDSDGQ